MPREIMRVVDAFRRGEITRRQLGLRLMALGAAAAGLSGVVTGAEEEEAVESTFQATGLDHIALNVTDLQRSSEFYQKHLGLTVMRSSASSVFLRCGPDFVALFRRDQPAMDHYCYDIRDYDPDTAVQKLREAGLEPRRRANRVYFDDPDGLVVQVASPGGGSG
jgi:catechol-2,3-dioxygenase